MAEASAPAPATATTTQFAGEICIVTGGTTGIGAAACRAFSELGAKVYNVDICPQEHTDAIFRQCDVSRVPDLQACFASILEVS